jgi:site-specific DNA-methyltransferase (adenine-specific)
MAKMPDNFIDLTVTSPPYDNLREYKGYSFDFESIANGLFRVTKQGGVIVWVVGDATINGSETGTSFRQALYFKEIGFNLHDTCIFKKKNPMPQNHNRLDQCFEYVFVFSKKAPKTFNPIYEDCITIGTIKKRNQETKSAIDGKSVSRKRDENTIVKSKKYKTNILEYAVGVDAENETGTHPAIFPQQLAKEQIYMWSNPNDLIYDPFTGSGTTPKMAVKLGRNWIGSEISSEYCEIANKRISDAIKLTGTPDPTKAIHGQQINLF